MITLHVQRKVILAIVIMSFLMFTASFALAVSGGRPWPGAGCGERLSYLSPPYMGTVTVKWLRTCQIQGMPEPLTGCVFMDGEMAQSGNSECQASFSDYYVWAGQDGNDFMNLHPHDIIGLCKNDLQMQGRFPCHEGNVPLPGEKSASVEGIELVSVGNIQYTEDTYDYKEFTASVAMMAVAHVLK